MFIDDHWTAIRFRKEVGMVKKEMISSPIDKMEAGSRRQWNHPGFSIDPLRPSVALLSAMGVPVGEAVR
jgi:hypothetical protein